MKKLFVGIAIIVCTLATISIVRAEGVLAPSTITHTLKLYSKGAEVSFLQQFLKEQGFFIYATPTGTFGSLTKQAVVAFQKKYGITPTGIVGPITRAKIAELVSQKTAAPAPYTPRKNGGTNSWRPDQDTVAPAIPSNLIASAVTQTSLSLTWNAATDTGGSGLHGYVLERCEGSGCITFTQISNPTNPNYDDSGLTADTTYRYRVKAVDSAGNMSGYSSALEVTTSPNTYTLGGTVSGLAGTGLILQNNGGDNIPLDTNGLFTFATPATEGTPYNITVYQQPVGQTCSITNGSGILGGSNITNISVNCSVALVAITVTPNNSNLPKSINEQFTAIGHYADSNTADITTSVTWDTSNHSVATIDTTGLGIGTGAGTAQISATLSGVTGITNITVTNATLISISVQPSNANLPIGVNAQYTAYGMFSDGSTVDITHQVTWDSSHTDIATINTTGLVTGSSPGTTQVSASLTSVTGITSLTVTDAILVSIAISPLNPAVARGGTLQLVAHGTFSDSSAVDITNQVTWTSSLQMVATINDTDHKGLVTGVAGGASSIHASLSSVTGTATLFVGA